MPSKSKRPKPKRKRWQSIGRGETLALVALGLVVLFLAWSFSRG